LYGERTPELVLEVLEDWIDWHAYRLAELAPGQVDNLYYQDLAQEGRLAVYRLLERDPHIWAPKLLRLAILSMYAARRRGRSVLRADPHHRLRTYEQVSWELMDDGGWGRRCGVRWLEMPAMEQEKGMVPLAVPFSCVDGPLWI
jgi:hypothetical protein